MVAGPPVAETSVENLVLVERGDAHEHEGRHLDATGPDSGKRRF